MPEEKAIRAAKDREEQEREEEESSDVERGKRFQVAKSVLGKRKFETSRKAVYRAKKKAGEIRDGVQDKDGKLPKRVKLTVRITLFVLSHSESFNSLLSILHACRQRLFVHTQ